MSTEAPETIDPRPEEPFQYRQLSTASVVSFGLGLASVSAILAGLSSWGAYFLTLPIPVVGLGLGWLALGHFREAGNGLAGRPLAVAGIACCLLCMLGGASVAGWIYTHEVPEGAVRIHFSALEPDSFELSDGVAIPPDIQALAGQRVFIKGYMRPGPFQNHIKNFLLVRDNGQCCFGPLDEVKFFDQIQVFMKEPLTVDYHPRRFKVAGTLAVNPRGLDRNTGEAVYLLHVDYVR